MTTQSQGRPRDASIDQRILEAAIELLATHGYEATTVDAVANAAAVSRPAIYRRFSNRNAIILHASTHVFGETAPDIRAAVDSLDEVLALLENTVELLVDTPAGAIFRNLIPYLDDEPELAKQANMIGMSRRKRLRAAVERAIDDGLLDPPLDIDLWLDAVLGAIYFRFLITGRELNFRYLSQLIKLGQ